MALAQPIAAKIEEVISFQACSNFRGVVCGLYRPGRISNSGTGARQSNERAVCWQIRSIKSRRVLSHPDDTCVVPALVRHRSLFQATYLSVRTERTPRAQYWRLPWTIGMALSGTDVHQVAEFVMRCLGHSALASECCYWEGVWPGTP